MCNQILLNDLLNFVLNYGTGIVRSGSESDDQTFAEGRTASRTPRGTEPRGTRRPAGVNPKAGSVLRTRREKGRAKTGERLVPPDPDRWDSEPYLSISIGEISAIRGWLISDFCPPTSAFRPPACENVSPYTSRAHSLILYSLNFTRGKCVLCVEGSLYFCSSCVR